MPRSISLNNVNNIIISVIVAIGLNYLLNPSESLANPMIAKLARIFPVSLVFVIVLFVSPPKKRILSLFYPFLAISIWFILNNLLDNMLALLTLFLFIGLGFFLSGYLQYESDDQIVSRGLGFLLIFWVFSLFLQVLIYFVTSEVFDFHNWFHPWSEARVHDVGLFIRFTGVLIEPGTYANWVYGVVILRGIASKKLFDGLSVVSMLSIFITLSAWGILAVGVYLITYLLNEIVFNRDDSYKKKLIVVGLLLATAALFYNWFSVEVTDALQYISGRSDLIDESGASKVEAYDGFINILIRILLVGVPIDYDFCNGCLSPQDAGIFVNLAVRAGLVFALTIFFVIVKCIYRRYGYVACTCIFPLIFAKYFYFEPLFWGIFAFSFLDFLRQKKEMR